MSIDSKVEAEKTARGKLRVIAAMKAVPRVKNTGERCAISGTDSRTSLSKGIKRNSLAISRMDLSSFF